MSKGFFKGNVKGKTFQEGTYTNVLEVVERGKLSKILEEQKISNSGLVDQGKAVEIGKLAGVQAIIMGGVTYTQETKDGKVEVRDKNGTYYQPARYRRVDVTYKMKIIDVQTGKLLGSVERNNGIEDTKYGDDINKIFSIQEGVDVCVSALAIDAANQITPHYELREFELQKVKAKNIKKIADKAAKKAENFDIDGAYLLYKSIYEKDPYNHKLLYNLGLLNEVVGNFKNAQEFYEQALQLKSDEKDYQKAVERINKSVNFANALAMVGVEIAEHNFEFSQAEQQEALAKTIKIKGKDSERIAIYKTARKGGEVIAKVPGGSTFKVLSAEGAFYKVKLIGDKVGYVSRDKAEMK